MEFDAAVEEIVHLMSLKPFKTKQIEALQAFISGYDTFVVLPTGWRLFLAILPLPFDKLLG